MAKRNVVDFKIINLSEEKFQELKEAGQIDPNALYTTPDESLKKNQITNCITEIPQDIKLELNNGTLTLKAGSKTYAPNGVNVFNVRNITADQAYTQTANGQYLLFVRQDLSIWGSLTSQTTSGTTPPAGTGTFYNTSTNTIDWYSGGTYNERRYSLPFALITVSNGAISSIDQVFNGFGRIGSTVFMLPGVKMLIPNGRNSDGTLESISKTITEVKTTTISSSYTGALDWFLTSIGNIVYYNENFMQYHEPANMYRYTDGFYYADCMIAKTKSTYGVINEFNPKTVFHAVDYSELNPKIVDDKIKIVDDKIKIVDDKIKIVDDKILTILNTIYPVGATYIGTQATCPMSAVIAGSTWELVSSGRALWTGNGSNANTTIAAGMPDIYGHFNMAINEGGTVQSEPTSGAFFTGVEGGLVGSYEVYGSTNGRLVGFYASRSNSIYGNSTTVQPPAFVVNVWRRTA